MHWYGRHPDLTVAIVATVMSVVTMIRWWYVRDWVRGLTLSAPWAWCFVPLAAIPGCELVCGLTSFDEPIVAGVRHLSALTLLCPTMALLGAKRPQHKPWSFVVLAFWFVLAIPGLRSLVLPGAGALQLDTFRIALLGVLLFLCLANYVLIRPIVFFFFLPQVFFLGLPALMSGDRYLGHGAFLVAFGLLCISAWLAIISGRRFSPTVAPNRRAGLNRVWWDFRAYFGHIWAMRVADQLNGTFMRNDWDVVLKSDGFAGESLDPETELQMQQAMANILRRFVSSQWIEERVE